MKQIVKKQPQHKLLMYTMANRDTAAAQRREAQADALQTTTQLEFADVGARLRKTCAVEECQHSTVGVQAEGLMRIEGAYLHDEMQASDQLGSKKMFLNGVWRDSVRHPSGTEFPRWTRNLAEMSEELSTLFSSQADDWILSADYLKTNSVLNIRNRRKVIVRYLATFNDAAGPQNNAEWSAIAFGICTVRTARRWIKEAMAGKIMNLPRGGFGRSKARLKVDDAIAVYIKRFAQCVPQATLQDYVVALADEGIILSKSSMLQLVIFYFRAAKL